MAAKSDSKPPTANPEKTSTNNYDKPQLREKLKDEIKDGDRGQWSARKAQLLTHEYEKAGGDYLQDKQTESQQQLEQWTEDKWQTADGKHAERADGTTRYLPKEAWNELSSAKQKATYTKKQAGSRAGKQVVANTEKAKTARKKVSEN